MTDDQIARMREAKRLVAQAYKRSGDMCQGCVDLTLAVNLLIGLMENHRHAYLAPDDRCCQAYTGPIQAREGQG